MYVGMYQYNKRLGCPSVRVRSKKIVLYVGGLSRTRAHDNDKGPRGWKMIIRENALFIYLLSNGIVERPAREPSKKRRRRTNRTTTAPRAAGSLATIQRDDERTTKKRARP